MWRRYACVRQTDQSDCGAAALATLALHHRRPIGLQQMRELARVEGGIYISWTNPNGVFIAINIYDPV